MATGDPLHVGADQCAGIEVFMPRLRFSCRDWGSHAEIEVLMPRLRCSCRDWGAHAEIEVLRPRLRSKMAPRSQNEHSNLGMSTSILAWAPQSQHSSYPPKSNSLFWGEWNKISNIIFYLQVGDIYKKYILQKWQENLQRGRSSGRSNLPPCM